MALLDYVGTDFAHLTSLSYTYMTDQGLQTIPKPNIEDKFNSFDFA